MTVSLWIVVLLVAREQVAERMPDPRRLEQPRRELVEERLEGVVVMPVDQHHLRVGVLQLLGGTHAGEPPAEDQDARHDGAIPQAPVADSPGSSRINDSPLRNAFGGQLIGSTARLRRFTSGRVSPVKSIR